MNIKEFRQKYPQYNDMPDDQLAKSLHQKFYADMPFEDFAGKIGLQQAERPGALARGARGVVRGLLEDPIYGAGQLMANIASKIPGFEDVAPTVNQWVKQNEQDYQQEWRGSQDDWDIGRTVGNVGSVLPFGAVGAARAGAGLMSRMGAAAGGGAVFGAAQPVTDGGGDFWTDKGFQVGGGALAGAAMAPVAGAVSRAISPNPTPEVQGMVRDGVSPTAGQLLGGMWKSTEETLASLPFVGGAQRVGQQRTLNDWNNSVINKALEPIGQKLPRGEAGYEAVRKATKALSDSQEQAIKAIGPLKFDTQFAKQLGQIQKDLQKLPLDKQDEVARIIQSEVAGRAPNGVLDPMDFKAADSMLGDAVRTYRAGDWSSRQTAQILKDLQRALRDTIPRQARPELADAYRRSNEGWAKFVRIQDAAAAAGNKEGVFTPAMLQAAVRNAEKSKGVKSRGDALMQDVADEGRKVISNELPNTHSADRLMMGMFATSPVTLGAELLPASIASLIYAPGVQRKIAEFAVGRQGPKAKAAARAVRSQGAVGAPLLSSQLQYMLGHDGGFGE